MSGVPYALLRSATPDGVARTERRIDPIHDGLFSISSSAMWTSRNLSAKRVAAGVTGKPPMILRADPDQAWAKRQDTMWWQRRLDVLGCLRQWSVLTTEQLVAFTGHTRTGITTVLSDLFAMDLVDCGLTVHPSQSTDKTMQRTALWRASTDAASWARLREMMTTVEALSVTGGSPSAAVHHYDRHNVVTAEFALRLTELASPGAVLGDTLSHARLLTALDGRPVPATQAQTQADMTIIRSDGLRIAVETTINIGRTFADKARSWARLLQMHPLRESGLVVLFLIAPTAAGSSTTIGTAERVARKQIRAAVNEYRGTIGDPTAARIFVARWDDYFPAPELVDPHAFTRLTASSPTGDADSGFWTEAHLLDAESVAFDPADPVAPLAVIDNVRGIRSTPWWMRRQDATDLADVIIRDGGFGAGVPQLRTPAHGKDRQLAGAGYGAAGAALTPSRLRF